MRVAIRLRLIVSFGFFLLALPLSCAVMNYGGLCVVRAERMSDARMINIAITQLLDSMRPPDSLWVEQGGRLVEVEMPANEVSYADVSEFLQLNPNCCRISMEVPALGWSAGFADRISGRLAGYVLIRYRDRPGMEGRWREAHVAVTNCGRAWDGI